MKENQVRTKIVGDPAPIVSFIVAVGRNGVIGRHGELPWRLSSDLKTFRRLTMGKPLIMGRKTWHSLGRPLDGRDNIVVTRDRAFAAEGAFVVHDVEAALELARSCAHERGVNEIMVIGGAHIFAALMERVERIYWTEVEAAPDGDVRFPAFDSAHWREVSREPLPQGPKDEFAANLRVLERVQS